MRVIVAGGRNFQKTVAAEAWLVDLLFKIPATEVVCGGAKGADQFGKEVAIKYDIPVQEFPAQWELFGKKAGYLRNAEMANYADACILFPGGKGTEMMCTLAKNRNLLLFEYPQEVETRIVNRENEAFDIYIGRPSKWGNPFQIGKDGTREEVINKYKDYIFDNPELLSSLHELKGKTLGCWCKPLPCHGDVLIELIKELGV